MRQSESTKMAIATENALMQRLAEQQQQLVAWKTEVTRAQTERQQV